jgi:multiple antibiotic resistance protein
VSLACWLALRFAEAIGRTLGPLGLNVVSRLLGLLLAAVAIEMMANGVKQLFPGLAG